MHTVNTEGGNPICALSGSYLQKFTKRPEWFGQNGQNINICTFDFFFINKKARMGTGKISMENFHLKLTSNHQHKFTET